MISRDCCPVKVTLVNAAERLLKRTSDRREGIIRVCPNQTNRADYEYEDYSQHHGIFRNVLALLIREEVTESFHFGGVPFIFQFSAGSHLKEKSKLSVRCGQWFVNTEL
jgi:hypothetical protein